MRALHESEAPLLGLGGVTVVLVALHAIVRQFLAITATDASPRPTFSGEPVVLTWPELGIADAEALREARELMGWIALLLALAALVQMTAAWREAGGGRKTALLSSCVFAFTVAFAWSCHGFGPLAFLG